MRCAFRPLVLAVVLSGGLLALAHGADDYRQPFETARQAHDNKAAQTALDAWKTAHPDDPEYYIAAANFLLSQGGGLTVSTKKAATGDFAVADQKTGQAVGSIAPSDPAPETYRAAVDLLKTGLQKAPQRVDIRLGLATLYKQLEDRKAVLGELAELTVYAKAHHDTLQGNDGGVYPAPVDENLALAINGFARRYFDEDTPENNQIFYDLAKLDADAYPGTVYGHNLLGIYYTVVDVQPKLALESYDRALKIVPTDSYVWMNVGLLNVRQKDKAKAAQAFNKIVELNNDPDCVKQAKGELAKLK